MFDVDQAVLAWRRDFTRARAFSAQDLDELEDHLRAAYDLERELNPSLPAPRAFAYAAENLGNRTSLSDEFAKVEGRGWRRLLRAGWLVYAVSFFLPVARYGVTLGQLAVDQGLLPGIQALLLSLGGTGGAIGVASALTNLLMVTTFLGIEKAGRRHTLLLSSLLLLGFGINLSWLVVTAPISDLFAGYWAWLSSFGLTGAALALRARALPAESDAPLLAADR